MARLNDAALGPGAEFDLIRRVLAAATTRHPRVRIGAGDDCAVIDGLAITLDVSIEGVHFRRDWLSDEECGWRAAAAALSDLAAMAAESVAAFAAVAASSEKSIENVMRGVRAVCKHVGAELAGGDVARFRGALVIDVVGVGACDDPVTRGGARAGDELWVTGRLGGAAAAVAAWNAGRDPDPDARAAFAHPVPRIEEARWLASHVRPTAMIDLSDGLAGDAAHIAAASGLCAVLEPHRLPVHPFADVALALGGGEDYELCFAATEGSVDVDAFHAQFGSPLTRVGQLVPGSGVATRDEDGETSPLSVRGYSHFEER